MSPKSMEQLIADQVRQWQLHRELVQLKAEEGEVPRRPVITISREAGSGVGELIRALSRRLGFQIHGRSLIDEIARDEGLERKVVAQLDEHTRSEVELWVQGLLNHHAFSLNEYSLSIARVVKALAVHGGAIILGRGAHLILGSENCLRLRVVEPLDLRVTRVQEEEGVSETEARQRIETADAERADFLRKLYDILPNDPHQYDLVINTEHLPGAEAVNLVLAAMEARGLF